MASESLKSPTYDQIQKSLVRLLDLGEKEGYTAIAWGLIMNNCSKMIAAQYGCKSIDEVLESVGVETYDELKEQFDA